MEAPGSSAELPSASAEESVFSSQVWLTSHPCPRGLLFLPRPSLCPETSVQGALGPGLNRARGLLSACLLHTLAKEEIVHPDLECSQGL